MDAERTAALLAAKLTALTRDRVGADPRPAPFPGGAGLVDGDAGWVLLGPDARAGLGAALAWARRAEVTELRVVTDDDGSIGRLARRAGLFTTAPMIWLVDGPTLVAAEAEPGPVPLPPPEAPELRSLLSAAGLELVDEDGVTQGEVLGLEVARIAHGPEGPELSVGVGRFDRELGEMTHAHLSPADRVALVVEIVARYRRPGAPPHPLNQLVPERWLRSALVADPSLVGAAELSPVASVDGRHNLRERGVASAIGSDVGGGQLVVSCSIGVDLELVPSAADDRAAHAPDARLVLAVPSRDALPLTRDLAARLAQPAEVVGLDGDWRIGWT